MLIRLFLAEITIFVGKPIIADPDTGSRRDAGLFRQAAHRRPPRPSTTQDVLIICSPATAPLPQGQAPFRAKRRDIGGAGRALVNWS
ncbi:hypothetical protein ACFVYA_22345 [Amycolatopsis sp. NPDC058278]|uniref:hypothetical protein n=1 Tax=Amycolatopsis sp. NPDC058278 TaxID=3346417 RepID=UPI0036DD16EB